MSLPLPTPSDSSHIYPSSILDDSLKAKIAEVILHPAIIIPARRTAELRRTLSHVLMHRPKIKDVYPLSDIDIIPNINPKSERKLVLTCKTKTETGASDSIYQDPILQQFLSQESSSTQSNVRKSTHHVTLGYDHYTVDQILSRILPEASITSTNNGTDIPSSFEAVGHLAHLNLREELWPYKFIIGRVILDKNKSMKVVVNKVGTIQNEFRTFPMELLAADGGGVPAPQGDSGVLKEGERCDKLEVSMKEDGCIFVMDFAKVYWNSRLQFEHRRLVELIAGKSVGLYKKSTKKERATTPTDYPPDTSRKETIVADACAGIGPFAIPLTSQFHNVTVYANDLNPISYRYLKINGTKNKCPESRLKLYNMDARQFLRKLDGEGIHYHHVLMNLPAIAPEFLDVFRGWKGDYDQRPMVHVHCFGGKDDAASDEALARCARALGCPLNKEVDETSVHIVRDVSPKKNMLCVSFRLPREVKDVEQVQQFNAVEDPVDSMVDKHQSEEANTMARKSDLSVDKGVDSFTPRAKKARSN